MKAIISKTIIACSVAAASLFGATAANAAVFNPFTVVTPGATHTFNADKITGNYDEIATFNPDNTFQVSLIWDAGQFATKNGTQALKPAATGLGSQYGIYALYKASGTVTTSGTATIFTFNPSAEGDLQFILDPSLNNGDHVSPLSGSGAFTIPGSEDDIVLATGVPVSGLGTLDPALPTCVSGGGINCGSFGSTTTFNLTAAGKTFFIAPNPFYTLSFQSGQLDNFNPTGTQEITGSLDVVFGNAVPEPASLGLLGLGLLGLGFARRRKQ
jgi:hypothetical protein